MTITLKQLEDWTGYSSRHIRDITGATASKIEVSSAFRSLSAHFQKQIQRQEKKGDQRERLACVRADKLEVERDVLKGNYVTTAHHEKEMRRSHGVVRSVLIDQLRHQFPLSVPEEMRAAAKSHGEKIITEIFESFRCDIAGAESGE